MVSGAQALEAEPAVGGLGVKKRAQEAKLVYHIIIVCPGKYKSFGCYEVKREKLEGKAGTWKSVRKSFRYFGIERVPWLRCVRS